MASTLADILGVSDELTYDGKVYKLSELSLEGRAKFSRWLERRARDEAIRGSANLPSDQQDRYLRVVSRDIAAGVYEFGGEVSVAALREPAGRRYIVYLSLLENHPDADEELAEKLIENRMREIAAILKKGVEESDPKVLAALRLIPGSFGVPQSSLQTTPSTGQ